MRIPRWRQREHRVKSNITDVVSEVGDLPSSHDNTYGTGDGKLSPRGNGDAAKPKTKKQLLVEFAEG